MENVEKRQSEDLTQEERNVEEPLERLPDKPVPQIEKIETARPIQDGPLLEIRRPQIDALHEQVARQTIGAVNSDEASISMALIEARSGSSSLVKRVTADLEGEGKKSYFLGLSALRRGGTEDIEEGSIVFIDEATTLHQEEYGDFEGCKKGLQELIGKKAVVVLLVHNNSRETVKKSFQEGLSQDVSEFPVESADRKQLGEIFDTVVAGRKSLKDSYDPEKNGRVSKSKKKDVLSKETVLDYCHSPAQVMAILKAVEDEDCTTLSEVIRIGDLKRFVELQKHSLRVTGGEHLISLIQKVGLEGIREDDLSEEEKAFMEEMTPFHYFDKDSEGNIILQGKILHEATQLEQ